MRKVKKMGMGVRSTCVYVLYMYNYISGNGAKKGEVFIL